MSCYCKAKCPECGTELEDLSLTVDPPIHLAICPKCGFKKRIEPYNQKPPLGCSPYYVAISARICELCEAIKRRSTESSGKYKNMRMWTVEIIGLIELERMLRREERNKVWVEDERGMLHEDRDD